LKLNYDYIIFKPQNVLIFLYYSDKTKLNNIITNKNIFFLATFKKKMTFLKSVYG